MFVCLLPSQGANERAREREGERERASERASERERERERREREKEIANKRVVEKGGGGERDFDSPVKSQYFEREYQVPSSNTHYILL